MNKSFFLILFGVFILLFGCTQKPTEAIKTYECPNGEIVEDIEECQSNIENEEKELTGCQYNNPSCEMNYDCVDNKCTLKSGCDYGNPLCDINTFCFNNMCLPKEIECEFDNESNMTIGDILDGAYRFDYSIDVDQFKIIISKNMDNSNEDWFYLIDGNQLSHIDLKVIIIDDTENNITKELNKLEERTYTIELNSLQKGKIKISVLAKLNTRNCTEWRNKMNSDMYFGVIEELPQVTYNFNTHQECWDDWDCIGSRHMCKNNMCVPFDIKCYVDSDCGQNAICEGGECQKVLDCTSGSCEDKYFRIEDITFEEIDKKFEVKARIYPKNSSFIGSFNVKYSKPYSYLTYSCSKGDTEFVYGSDYLDFNVKCYLPDFEIEHFVIKQSGDPPYWIYFIKKCSGDECTYKEGCEYGHPECSAGFECINNECVRLPCNEYCTANDPNSVSVSDGDSCNCQCKEGYKTKSWVGCARIGCEENNPSCDLDYDCVNNECIYNRAICEQNCNLEDSSSHGFLLNNNCICDCDENSIRSNGVCVFGEHDEECNLGCKEISNDENKIGLKLNGICICDCDYGFITDQQTNHCIKLD